MGPGGGLRAQRRQAARKMPWAGPPLARGARPVSRSTHRLWPGPARCGGAPRRQQGSPVAPRGSPSWPQARGRAGQSPGIGRGRDGPSSSAPPPWRPPLATVRLLGSAEHHGKGAAAAGYHGKEGVCGRGERRAGAVRAGRHGGRDGPGLAAFSRLPQPPSAEEGLGWGHTPGLRLDMASCEATSLAIVMFSGVPSETAQRGGNPQPVARQYQPKGNEKRFKMWRCKCKPRTCFAQKCCWKAIDKTNVGNGPLWATESLVQHIFATLSLVICYF